MSRCYDVIFRLYNRYKFYKNRCHELTLTVIELQRMDRYRTLSGGNIHISSLENDHQSGCCTPLLASTENVPKRTLFSTPEKNIENENEACDFTKEQQENLVVQHKVKDNTVLDDQITQSKRSKPSLRIEERKNENVWLSKPISKRMTYKKPAQQNKQLKVNNLEFSPGHICKYPRCKKHQPFFVSNIREIAKLSPNARALATNQRSKSPKGFWDLEICDPKVSVDNE